MGSSVETGPVFYSQLGRAAVRGPSPTSFSANIPPYSGQGACLKDMETRVQMSQLMSTLQNFLQKQPGNWWHTALDLLLPTRCLLCGLPSGAICICTACKKDLPWTGVHCPQCGLPLNTPGDQICGSCIKNAARITHTVCPLQYCFPVDRLVQSLKFKRQLAAGRVLSHLLCEWVVSHNCDHPDALVPVPLHSLRMFRRGFNQSVELAAYTGKVLDVPLLTGALRRHRNTRAQSGLSRKLRRKNVRGAFYWHGPARPGRHVALVDDVMTTGTTVNECARILKMAGAKRVDVWVAARAVPAGSR